MTEQMTILKVVCAWCGADMGEKDGEGEKGLSHGMCDKCYAKERLADFLLQQCEERQLSLRSLAIKAGLSPSTVHNIIKREYQPRLFTLNRLADYLGGETGISAAISVIGAVTTYIETEENENHG